VSAGSAPTAVEDIGAAFVEVDDDGWYVGASPDALRVYGVSLEELLRHRVGDFATSGVGLLQPAIFRWVVARGAGFAGGWTTLLSSDGRVTPVVYTGVERTIDRWRVSFRTRRCEPGVGSADMIAAVLEVWREAERDIARGPEDPAHEPARAAVAFLRDMYQALVAERTAAITALTDRHPR